MSYNLDPTFSNQDLEREGTGDFWDGYMATVRGLGLVAEATLIEQPDFDSVEAPTEL